MGECIGRVLEEYVAKMHLGNTFGNHLMPYFSFGEYIGGIHLKPRVPRLGRETNRFANKNCATYDPLANHPIVLYLKSKMNQEKKNKKNKKKKQKKQKN